jgi:hypothetical protein
MLLASVIKNNLVINGLNIIITICAIIVLAYIIKIIKENKK